MFCPKCGGKNSDEAKFCTTCGNPLPVFQPGPVRPAEAAGSAEQPTMSAEKDTSNERSFDFAKTVEPAGSTGPYVRPQGGSIPPVDELEQQFFGKKAEYYLLKRSEMTAKNSKVSWNWASFLFSFYWAFYRKLYSFGGILLGIYAAINILGCFIYSTAFSVITLLVSVGICFVAGLFGNYAYLDKADKYIAEARQMPPSEQKVYLSKKGGTSVGVVILLYVLMLAITAIRLIWPVQSVPGAVLGGLGSEQTTSTIPMGETFGQDDLAITPIEVTYTSSSIYYDWNYDPYVSISLAISCLSETWEPQYEDVTFWIDGSSAFSQPDFQDVQIQQGEQFVYTFSQPLVTSSVQDAEMMLRYKCKTGIVVELHFIVDGIQEFFQNNSAYSVPWLSDMYGYYTKPSGEGFTYTYITGDDSTYFSYGPQESPYFEGYLYEDDAPIYSEDGEDILYLTEVEPGQIVLTCETDSFMRLPKAQIEGTYYLTEPDYCLY